MGLQPTTSTLRVGHATHCPTPLLLHTLLQHWFYISELENVGCMYTLKCFYYMCFFSYSFVCFTLWLLYFRPHTLQSSSTHSLPTTVTGLIGDLNSPYMKHFVQSKSQQYRKLKTEWKNLVYLGRSRIQVSEWLKERCWMIVSIVSPIAVNKCAVYPEADLLIIKSFNFLTLNKSFNLLTLIKSFNFSSVLDRVQNISKFEVIIFIV